MNGLARALRAPGVALALALPMTACSIIIGDIELPPGQTHSIYDLGGDSPPVQDMNWPADAPDSMDLLGPTDAASLPADTTTDGPAADLFTELDAAPPAPDLGPPPSADLNVLIGRWQIVGLVDVEGVQVHVGGMLEIPGDRAKYLDDDGIIQRAWVNLAPVLDGTGLYRLELPGVPAPMHGTFAPTTGFGAFGVKAVLHPGYSAAVYLMRVLDPPYAPPDLMAYQTTGPLPSAGNQEIGTLATTMRERVYEQGSRTELTRMGLSLLAPRLLELTDLGGGRQRLTHHETGDHYLLTSNSLATGLYGTSWLGDGRFGGLFVGWMGTSLADLPVPGALYCAGQRLSPGGARGTSSIAGFAQIDGDGVITWETGESQRFVRAMNTFRLVEGQNPFGLSAALSLQDGQDELFIFLPVNIEDSELAWGHMACIRTHLPGIPLEGP